MLLFRKITTFIISAMICAYSHADAKVNALSFDSSVVINQAASKAAAVQALDSMLLQHPLLASNNYLAKEQLRVFSFNTLDFYLILFLLLSFGAMRFFNPRYFQNLVRAFRSPSFGNQQLKEQMGTALFPNFLMNIFFAVTVGLYIYYVFKLSIPQRYAIYNPSLLITILIVSLASLYAAKYAVMRFSGWAFNVRVIISHYMYNVFLINKIIAVALLPFIVLLAFAHPILALPSMIVSLFLVVLLFISRYIRSWQVLGSFFQYSKFHFFAYLCASELLPMAILAKLLIRGMYY